MSSGGSPNRSSRTAGAFALVAGLAVLVAGCASSGAVPRPFPTPSAPEARSPASRQAIADLAVDFRGTPYRSGGADPSGFDCSGLVQYVLAQRGLAMPRLVSEQFLVGRPVDRRSLTPGDLVFFRIDSRDISHVGIALGDGAFVHAPKSNGAVRIESLDAPYWSERFAGARRVSD
jgi:cell wall-associated NlpC family hydrolase